MKKVLKNVALAVTACCAFSLAGLANTQTVWVWDNQFMPNSANICLGDTMLFVYDTSGTSIAIHNVHITTPVDSTSQNLTASGDTFMYVPTAQGMYSYQCDFHVLMGMTGTFTVGAPPTVNLGSDINQCGGTVTLDAGNPGLTYVWSTGETTQTISVTSSGNYWVVVYNSCGNSTDNINVTYNASAVTVNLGPNATYCGQIILDAGNTGLQYVWNNQNSVSTQTIEVNTTSTNWVQVTNSSTGCVGYDTIDIVISGVNPLVEGFEGTGFPPSGWTVNNPDNSTTWVQTSIAAKNGTYSMYMDNHSYSAVGQRDEIISPVLCDMTGVIFTFQVAYQLYTNPASSPNYSDTLIVQYSTDGGTNWTTAYNKSGTGLTTVVPAYSPNPFIPTSTQWRRDSITLPNAPSMMIKFINVTSYENQLYIDDINIYDPVAVEEISFEDYVSVYPNPSSGNVTVNINANDIGNVTMKVYNMIGGVVFEKTENISSPTELAVDISNQPDGLYFLEIRNENSKAVKKLIIGK